MSPELETKLYKKYPKIFSDIDKDMTESPMYWGLEINDGWYDLIDTLCSTMQNWIDNNSHRNISQVVAEQVKEKYGTLRFYVRGGDNYTDGMITLAESMSEKICELCGDPGQIRNYSWVSTLCEIHATNRREKII